MIDRRLLLATAGASALLRPGVGHAQSAPVKVGVILPTSGVLASSGQAALRGIRLGETIMRETGAPKLEIITADTQSKPENGRIAAESLIGQGCTVLIGAWDTGATISAAQAAEAAKVPLVINIASAPQITEQGFTQIFRNFPAGNVMVSAVLPHLKALFATRAEQPKSAVVLHVNDTFGNGILTPLVAQWEKSGMPCPIVEKIGYDVTTRDLSVEVAKAKATGADLLLPITRVNDAVMIVREMVKQRWNPLAVCSPGSPGPYEKAFTDAVGKYGDDYMVCVPWYNPRNPKAMALVERYERENAGQRFELNVGFSYEAVLVVADAVRRAGSAEPAALHAALRATDIDEHPMAGGPIRFDAKGQNTGIGVVLLQDRDSRPTVVLPKAYAVAEPRYPFTPFAQRG